MLEGAMHWLVQDLYDFEGVRHAVLVSWGVFRKKRDRVASAQLRVADVGGLGVEA